MQRIGNIGTIYPRITAIKRSHIDASRCHTPLVEETGP